MGTTQRAIRPLDTKDGLPRLVLVLDTRNPARPCVVPFNVNHDDAMLAGDILASAYPDVIRDAIRAATVLGMTQAIHADDGDDVGD